VRDAPTFRAVLDRVAWSGVSRRHFDQVTRPLLERVTAALLQARRGLDLHRHPGAARELLGEHAWKLVDPARPASEDSAARGVDLGDIEDLLSRLEEL
jgi:hypothetical protein